MKKKRRRPDFHVYFELGNPCGNNLSRVAHYPAHTSTRLCHDGAGICTRCSYI